MPKCKCLASLYMIFSTSVLIDSLIFLGPCDQPSSNRHKLGANHGFVSTVFCDYCDVYLTHDSMSVRKAHNSGRNHLRNVVDYYQQIGHEKAQPVIDSITSSYAAAGQAHPNPMLPQNQPGAHGAPGGPPGAFPPPFNFPGGMPPPFPGMPGAPPMLPPGGAFPAGLPRK